MSLARRYICRGACVWGTYRSWSAELEDLQSLGAVLSFLDVDDPKSVAEFAGKMRATRYSWNRFISAVGV